MILDQKATPAIGLLPNPALRDINGRSGSRPALPCETKWSRDGTTTKPASLAGFAILDRKVGKIRDEELWMRSKTSHLTTHPSLLYKQVIFIFLPGSCQVS
jgi:hypothetical protein